MNDGLGRRKVLIHKSVFIILDFSHSEMNWLDLLTGQWFSFWAEAISWSRESHLQQLWFTNNCYRAKMAKITGSSYSKVSIFYSPALILFHESRISLKLDRCGGVCVLNVQWGHYSNWDELTWWWIIMFGSRQIGQGFPHILSPLYRNSINVTLNDRQDAWN